MSFRNANRYIFFKSVELLQTTIFKQKIEHNMLVCQTYSVLTFATDTGVFIP